MPKRTKKTLDKSLSLIKSLLNKPEILAEVQGKYVDWDKIAEMIKSSSQKNSC